MIASGLLVVISPYYKKYLPSAAHALKNSPKISHLTNRDIFQLNLSQIDEKLG